MRWDCTGGGEVGIGCGEADETSWVCPDVSRMMSTVRSYDVLTRDEASDVISGLDCGDFTTFDRPAVVRALFVNAQSHVRAPAL